MIKAAYVGALVSVALCAPRALAQEELLHLQFQSAAGCPNRDAFVAEVEARTERVRFVEKARHAVLLRVRANVEGERAVGRFRLGSQNVERLVTGKTCADVISALALIAALAVDPAAASAIDASTPAIALAADAAHAAAEESGPEGLVRGVAPPETADVAPSRKVDSSGNRWFGGAGAQGELSRGFGVGAITLMGASVHGEAGYVIGGPWRPTLRLSAVWTQSPTVVPTERPDTGAAMFTLIAGRGALCPLELRPHESFVLRPCATLEVGRLEGTARPVDNGSIKSLRSGTAWRVATGQSLQGRARLGGRLWLELEAGAMEPLVRQSFVFSNPDVTVSSTPVIEVALALGLGVYFP